MKRFITADLRFGMEEGRYRSPSERPRYAAHTMVSLIADRLCEDATTIWFRAMRERILADASLRPSLMAIVAEHHLDLSGFPVWRANKREITGSDEEVIAFWCCLQILKDRIVQKRPPARSPSTSYNLKHKAERWASPNVGNYYVGNGIMVAAIIHLGIPFEYSGHDAIPALRKEKWKSRL